MVAGHVASARRGPEALLRTPAAREVIPRDPRYSTRWLQHDYPSPIARWNFHPEYELHLVTAGSGRFIVGDRVGNFGPGHLVLVGPELPHHWISELAPNQTVPGRDVVLQWHDSWLQSCIEIMPELGDLQPLLRHAARGIEFVGETAERGAAQLVEIGGLEGTARLVATLRLLGTLASAPDDERRLIATEWIPPHDDPRAADVVNRALDYIFSTISGDVRLSAAAEMIGMSESAFSRYFTRASGQTFSSMVRKLRIAQACKLLDTTGDSISAIAQATGYRNLSNFNRQFLLETGETPRGYRGRERG